MLQIAAAAGHSVRKREEEERRLRMRKEEEAKERRFFLEREERRLRMRKEEEEKRLRSRKHKCQICMDWKLYAEMFRSNCKHHNLSCTDCMGKYVATKINDKYCPSSVRPVYCPFPGCRTVLDPRLWRSTVPPQVFDRYWQKRKTTTAAAAAATVVEEEGDKLFWELVKDKKWRRCPACRFFIEKRSGCSQIRCRCGYRFCYKSGEERPQDPFCCCL